ncbi:monocarboxylate transporter 12 isoform X2 [Hetaerina americana]|uniref:monocarboxylate transporter 12 isoform X2 n=1 Tax=Hetaerina americana TaxID=62018 RepID=UPI003A7F2468
MVSEKGRANGGKEGVGEELLSHGAHGPPSPDQGIPPPDGGWGWMVVFGSFMIHIIADGVTYSFGIFYLEFLHYFKEGKGKTAWIASILVGVTLCSGPISSVLVNRYGCRPVTIAGAILASACMILSMFAEDVLTLYFTIGVGTGFGFGLMYLPAIVSVTCYFERRRSLATGIAVCGSGLGTFLFAPLTGWLIETFGWRGALLLISSATMHCVIFGGMFRPLEAPRRRKKAAENALEAGGNGTEMKSMGGTGNADAVLGESTSEVEGIFRSNTFSSSKCNGNEGDKTKEENDQGNGTRSQRPTSFSGNIPVVAGQNATNAHAQRGAARRSGNNVLEGSKSVVARMALSQPALYAPGGKTMATGGHEGAKVGRSMASTSKGVLMSREDIFYTGSLVNIAQHRSTQRVHRVSESCAATIPYDDEELESLKGRKSGRQGSEQAGASQGNEEALDVESGPICCGLVSSPQAKEVIESMMDFSLLSDPIFILFAFSNFCTSIGFNIPYVYVVATAEEAGIPKEQASILLAVIGVANTVGRIILGYLSDKPFVNRLWVYNICLTVCGAATFFSAFCQDFISLALYASVFGFTIGAYVGLTSVILVDLLGLAKLTNAFGLLLLFQGIASFLGPPIAGWLYDALGSYDPGFYVAGVTIALSGLVLFFIPALQRCIKVKSQS